MLQVRVKRSSTSTYTGSDMSSRPRNSVRKLSDDKSRQKPYSEESSRMPNGPLRNSARAISTTGIANASTAALASDPDGAIENWLANGASVVPCT